MAKNVKNLGFISDIYHDKVTTIEKKMIDVTYVSEIFDIFGRLTADFSTFLAMSYLIGKLLRS